MPQYYIVLTILRVLTLTGEVTVWALDGVDVSPGVLSEQSLVGKPLEAEATSVVGVTRGFSLSVEVVLQLRVVGEEAATPWTGNHLLCCVNTTMLKKLATITTAMVTI